MMLSCMNTAFHFCSVDDGEEGTATCYYCLLRQGAAIIPELGRLKASAMGDSYCSNEFVICFLTAGDVTLDLYPFYTSELQVTKY